MARFDRRTNYPLYNPSDTSATGLATDALSDATFTTLKVGGVIRVRGAVPPNIQAVSLGHPYLYKVAADRRDSGGTSRFYGSRR